MDGDGGCGCIIVWFILGGKYYCGRCGLVISRDNKKEKA